MSRRRLKALVLVRKFDYIKNNTSNTQKGASKWKRLFVLDLKFVREGFLISLYKLHPLA
jgi:hypothetical protein